MSFQRIFAVCVLSLAGLPFGCATERATVFVDFVVEPSRGLPEGMKGIIIQPAQVGETTDPKWSELTVAILQSLVNDSINEFGTPLVISDRRDARLTFENADMIAAGMVSSSGGQTGQLLAAEGAILANVNVMVEEEIGRQRTLSNISIAGITGDHVDGGELDIETEEVDTVTRTLTVQTEFKLQDLANGRQWQYYKPRTYSRTDRTHASPIFGSSRTSAELRPVDRLVRKLVERGAQEFVSQLMPCRIQAWVDVESSLNPSCMEGVRMLRGEAFEEAISNFEAALSADRRDHRAAFGAGVACERLGRFSDALGYYRRASSGERNEAYEEARDRMNAFGDRARIR